MSTLFLAMMSAWPLLLHSLAPLLLAIICLLASAYLIMAADPHRSAVRKRSDYLLAAGNLLATCSWGLIYADTVLSWRHPLWDFGAPLGSLACLLLLPVAMATILSRRKQLQLTDGDKTAFILSLLFHTVSLYPGIYLLTFYLAVFSDVR